MSGSAPWKRWRTVIPAAAVALALNWYTLAWALSAYGYDSYVGWGESMSPTLEVGDRFFVAPWLYRVREPQRGDMVVFNARYWDGRDVSLLKRVVGLPGEEVNIGNGALRINGVRLEEEYVQRSWFTGSSYHGYTVPEGKYFVLGDNRGNSWDSRNVGPIERERLAPAVPLTSNVYLGRWLLIAGFVGSSAFFAWQAALNRERSAQWTWLGAVFLGVGVGIVMMLPDAEPEYERELDLAA